MGEEREKMREAIAKEYGFALYRQYGEKEACYFLGVDLSTLKRRRAKGEAPHVRMGPRHVRYLGLHIADMLLGDEEWQNTPSGNTNSADKLEAKESELARRTFSKHTK